ncbi:MAG TPA: FmdB family zinc ribbon protein [Verrucomicrobiae bacterium]|nr:FmdB family zinc ribbon protein [Verrucomicrobiae bacterium]
MPTYEYECQKCGHHYELYQSIKDGPKRTCPKCHGRVKRLLGTGAGLIFKGSGFYITDYRKPSYAESAKKDNPAPTTPVTPAAGSTTSAKTSPAKPASAPTKSGETKATKKKD